MSPHSARSSAVALATLVVVLALARPAAAGPPLLCHPFDIGSARSLPWNGSTGWRHTSAGYNVRNLVADTEAILAPSTPVIVRMETLRRAAIYASGDRTVASTLLARLRDRVRAADLSGRPDALALHDAAYFVEALRQLTRLEPLVSLRDPAASLRDLVAEADGPALMRKSLEARPDDPSLEFAAALIVADKDRAAYERHAAKARAGASRDPLLARNIGAIS
jgi:hypothetical protein